MRQFDYVTLDVFTDRRFGGNPLAVILDGQGLSDEEMQAIAAEFNYSETTVVLPSAQGLGPVVRIFTPRSELPFAGHPTVGTAVALRNEGRLSGIEAVLEEKAGPVPVVFSDDSRVWFRAPGQAHIEPSVSRDDGARALGLPPGAIVSAPCVAGAGLNFPFVEVVDRAALAEARPTGEVAAIADEVVAFADLGAQQIGVRVFAPGHGIPEDPATGSAAAGLAVLLAGRHEMADGELAWTISQGVEMGRPSQINIRAVKAAHEIKEIFVEGQAVSVMRGQIEL